VALGVVVGLALIVGLPMLAVDPTIEQDFGGSWQLVGLALLILIGCWVLGIVLPRTVGVAAVGLVVGGIAGAVFALFAAHATYMPGFLLIALVGVLVQNVQAIRLGRGP
jgi:hypothetical protein